MTTLTPEQRSRQQKRQQEHWQRQARMPKETRPRWSPQKNMPGRHQHVYPTQLTSMRTCMENPELHPNNFRYLFRKANLSPGLTEYIWLDIDGVQLPNRSFPSLVSAIKHYLDQGWEDASW